MENFGYYSIREFLENHCDDFTLDLGRRVYKDYIGNKITLLSTEETRFDYEGYYVTCNNHYIYSGYDEVRDLDTLFVQNPLNRFGKDIMLAKFKHVEIQELEDSNGKTKD